MTYTHSCKYTRARAEEKGRQREIERGETKDKRFGEGGGGRERGKKRKERKEKKKKKHIRKKSGG